MQVLPQALPLWVMGQTVDYGSSGILKPIDKCSKMKLQM